MRGDGVAGDQTSAANWNHHHVEVWNVGKDLQGDRALAGDDAGIVIRVDDDEPALLGDFHGAGLRLVQTSTREDDFGAEGLGIGHLHEGRVLWHDDGCGDAQAACVISDGLGVVAGRHGDHAPACRAVAERGELHQRAASLKELVNWRFSHLM